MLGGRNTALQLLQYASTWTLLAECMPAAAALAASQLTLARQMSGAGTSTSASDASSTVNSIAATSISNIVNLSAPEQVPGVPSADSPAWPFIDASRPQVRPKLVPRGCRPAPSPLADAIRQVLANAEARKAIPKRAQKGKTRNPFDETFEAVFNLNLDRKKSDQQVRGAVVLPYGTGKRVRVVVFASGADADIARREGADIVAGEELIQSIVDSGGANIDFQAVIATPDFMKPLTRVGKILGPKGLMPNPRMGTLTSDVSKALREMRAGRLVFKADADAVMHAALGKVSMKEEQIIANIGAFVDQLLKLRPKAVPGEGLEGYVKAMFFKSTFTKIVPVLPDSCWVAVAAHQQLEELATAKTVDELGTDGSAAVEAAVLGSSGIAE